MKLKWKSTRTYNGYVHVARVSSLGYISIRNDHWFSAPKKVINFIPTLKHWSTLRPQTEWLRIDMPTSAVKKCAEKLVKRTLKDALKRAPVRIKEVNSTVNSINKVLK